MPSTPPKSSLSVPTLYYEDFGSRPEMRLNTLRALSVLMSCSAGLHSAQSLGVSEGELKALRSWLLNRDGAGDALSFWRADTHGVRVLRVCTSHVLVGTNRMLHDLAELGTAITSSNAEIIEPCVSSGTTSMKMPSLSLDEMWQAARCYVAAEVNI